ncbi:hypothetical protein PSH70_07615 [Pseudomonas fluorescens]|uniref:hypothetical protein n=1 Tax=Pseudomonas fluorescens TaxID=294 RepID=UPI00273A3CDA|nr:hypothetical protein [Pseudomonas fluorescens]WLH75331.1 hypothetical protein PSH70_07615 [Pseudomonas fluorescens]
MTTFNPTAVLANLSDADLMAPLTFDGAALEAPTPTAVAVDRHSGVPDVPAMASLLAQADAIALAAVISDLPPRTLRITGVPAVETVSASLRRNGGKLSESLRQAVGEHIKTADDLRYALRVFASHGVNSLIGNRYGDLIIREQTAAKIAGSEWTESVLTAVQGEVAAVHAAEHLSAAEFKFLLELVDTDRAVMAQNLAGLSVDVPALVKGRGLDWRELAGAWADACGARGNVTFEAGKNAAGWSSYNITVEPGAGWVLSTFVDTAWIPLEASAAGKARALYDREQVMLARSQAAKPEPYLGTVFADKLRGEV